ARRARFVVEVEVRRGKAQETAARVAADHLAEDGDRAAEHALRVAETALADRLADRGRRDHVAFLVGGLERELARGEAELGAEALEEREIARAPLAEAVVRAEEDLPRAEGANEDRAHELVGRRARGPLVEGQDHGR